MDRPIKPNTHVKHPYSYLIRSMFLGILLLLSSVFSSYAVTTNFFGLAGGDNTNQVEAAASGYWTNYKATSFAGGSGTASSPYQIATAAQLARLANTTSSYPSYRGSYFILTANIDLSAHYWVSIGNIYKQTTTYYRPWYGYFDGGGYVISGLTQSYNYYMGSGMRSATSATGYVCSGLFGLVDANSSKIQNVVIEYADIRTYGLYVGAVVGRLYSSTGASSQYVVQKCSVISSRVQSWYDKATNFNFVAVGGVIGCVGGKYNSPNSNYELGTDFYASSYIDLNYLGASNSVVSSQYAGNVGGVVGAFVTTGGSNLTECYFEGTIFSTSGTRTRCAVGGILGLGDMDDMSHCYFINDRVYFRTPGGTTVEYTEEMFYNGTSNGYLGGFNGYLTGNPEQVIQMMYSGYVDYTLAMGNVPYAGKNPTTPEQAKTNVPAGMEIYEDINDGYPIITYENNGVSWLGTTVVSAKNGGLQALIGTNITVDGRDIQVDRFLIGNKKTIITYGTSKITAISYNTSVIDTNYFTRVAAINTCEVYPFFNTTSKVTTSLSGTNLSGQYYGTRNIYINDKITSKNAYVTFITPDSSYGYIWLRSYYNGYNIRNQLTPYNCPGNIATYADANYVSGSYTYYRIPANSTITWSVPYYILISRIRVSVINQNPHEWVNPNITIFCSTSGTTHTEYNYISYRRTYGDYNKRFNGWVMNGNGIAGLQASTSYISLNVMRAPFSGNSTTAGEISTSWTDAYYISNSTLYYETASGYGLHEGKEVLLPSETSGVSVSANNQSISLPSYGSNPNYDGLETLTVQEYFSDSASAFGKYAVPGTVVNVKINTTNSSLTKWYISRITIPGNKNAQHNLVDFGSAISFTVTDHVTSSTGRSNYFMAYVYKTRAGIKITENFGGTLTLTIKDINGSTVLKTISATNGSAETMMLWDNNYTLTYTNSSMTDQPISTTYYSKGRYLGLYSSTSVNALTTAWSFGSFKGAYHEAYLNKGLYETGHMTYTNYFYVKQEAMYTQTLQYANSSGVTTNSVSLTLTNGTVTQTVTANQSSQTKYLYCVSGTKAKFVVTLADSNRSYCAYSYTTSSGGTSTGNVQATTTVLSSDNVTRARTYKGTFYTQYYYINLQHNSMQNSSSLYFRYSKNNGTYTTLSPNSYSNITKVASLQYGDTITMYVSTSSTSNVAPNLAKINNNYNYAVWGIYRDSAKTTGAGVGKVGWEDSGISSTQQATITISTTTANKSVIDENPAAGTAKKTYGFYSEALITISYRVESNGLTNVGGSATFSASSYSAELSASKPTLYMYYNIGATVKINSVKYSNGYNVLVTLGPDVNSNGLAANLVTTSNGATTCVTLPYTLGTGFKSYGATLLFRYELAPYTLKTTVAEEGYSTSASNLNTYGLTYTPSGSAQTTVSSQKAALSKTASGGSTSSLSVVLNAYNGVKQYYALVTVNVDGTNVITNQKATTDSTVVSYKHTYGFVVTISVVFEQLTWDRTVSTGPTITNNTITIANTTDYAKFAYGAVNGNNYSGISVNITADLDLSKYLTYPLGAENRYYAYAQNYAECSINGKAHTISGVRIIMNGSVSWFAETTDHYSLSNIILENFNIHQGNPNLSSQLSAITCVLYGNLSNVGVINPTITAYGKSTVGGITNGFKYGEIKNSYITNCTLKSDSGVVGGVFVEYPGAYGEIINSYVNIASISTSGTKALMGTNEESEISYNNCYAVGNGSILFKNGNGTTTNCMVINGASSDTVTKATTAQGRDMSFAMNTAKLDMENTWCYMGQGVTNGTFNDTIKQPDYGYPVLTGFMGCDTGRFVVNKVVNSNESGYSNSTETGYTIAPHVAGRSYSYNVTAIPHFTVKQNSKYNETYGSIKSLTYGSVNLSTITSFDTSTNSAYKLAMTRSGLTATVTFETHRITINTTYSSLFANATKYVVVWWNGANTITNAIKSSLIDVKDIIIGSVHIAGTNVTGYNNKTLYEYHDNGLDKTVSATVGSGTKTVTTSGGNTSVSCKSTNVRSDETYTLTPYVAIKVSLLPDSLGMTANDVTVTLTSSSAKYKGDGSGTLSTSSVTKTFSKSSITDRNNIILYSFINDSTNITITSQAKVNGANYVSGGDLPKAILTSIDYPTFTASSGNTVVTMVGDTSGITTGTEADYTTNISKTYTQVRSKHSSGTYNGVPMVYVADGTVTYELNYSMASNAVEFIYSETVETGASVVVTANEAVGTKTATLNKSNTSALMTIPFGSDGNINYKLAGGSKVYLVVLKDENGAILKSASGTGTLSIDYATIINAGRKFYINVYEYFTFTISANQTLAGEYGTSYADTLTLKGITSTTAPSNSDYSGKTTLSVNSKTYYVYGTTLSLSAYLNATNGQNNETYLNAKYNIYSSSDTATSSKVTFTSSQKTANVTLKTTHAVTVNYKVNTLTIMLERSNSMAEIPVIIPYKEVITYNGTNYTEKAGGVKYWMSGAATVSGSYVYTFNTDTASSMIAGSKYINTITYGGKKILTFDSSKSTLGSNTFDSARKYAYTISYGEAVRFLRGDDDSTYKANVFAVIETSSGNEINTYTNINEVQSAGAVVKVGIKTSGFSYPANFANTIRVASTFSVTYWPLFQLTTRENFELESAYAKDVSYKANGTFAMYRTNQYVVGTTIDINNVNTFASNKWFTFEGNKSPEGYWIKVVYTPKSSDLNNFDFANMTVDLYDTTISVGQTKTITLTNYGTPNRTVYAKFLKNGNNYELYFNLVNAYNYDITTTNGEAEHVFVYNVAEKVYTFNARYLIDSATPNANPATIQVLEYKDLDRQTTPTVRSSLTSTNNNVQISVGAMAVMSYKISSVNTTLYNAPTAITTSDSTKLSVGGTVATMNWIFDVSASGATVTANFTSKFTLNNIYQIKYVTTGYNDTEGALTAGTAFGTATVKVGGTNYVEGNRFTYGSSISVTVTPTTNYVVTSITFYNADTNAVLKTGTTTSLTLDSATTNVKLVVVYTEKEYTFSAGIQLYKGSATDGAKVTTSTSTGVASIDGGKITMTVTSNHKTSNKTKVGALGKITMVLTDDSNNTNYIYKGTVATSVTPTSSLEESVIFQSPTGNATITAKYNRLLTLTQPTSNYVTTTNPSSSRIDRPQATVSGTPSRTIGTTNYYEWGSTITFSANNKTGWTYAWTPSSLTGATPTSTLTDQSSNVSITYTETTKVLTLKSAINNAGTVSIISHTLKTNPEATSTTTTTGFNVTVGYFSTVTIRATANTGYRFNNWTQSVSGYISTGSSDTQVPISSKYFDTNLTITANWVTTHTYTIPDNLDARNKNSTSTVLIGTQNGSLYIQGNGGAQQSSITVDTNSNVTFMAKRLITVGGKTYRFSHFAQGTSYATALTVGGNIVSISSSSSNGTFDTLTIKANATTEAIQYHAMYVEYVQINADTRDLNRNGSTLGGIISATVNPNNAVTIDGVDINRWQNNNGLFDVGTKLTLTAPSISGYRFAGWKTDLSSTSYLSTSNSYTTPAISAVTTYYAIYIKQFSIATDSVDVDHPTDDDGNFQSLGVTNITGSGTFDEKGSTTLKAPTTYTKNGVNYKFVGWKTSYNGTSFVSTSSSYTVSNITANATYYACYKMQLTLTITARDNNNTKSWAGIVADSLVVTVNGKEYVLNDDFTLTVDYGTTIDDITVSILYNKSGEQTHRLLSLTVNKNGSTQVTTPTTYVVSNTIAGWTITGNSSINIATIQTYMVVDSTSSISTTATYVTKGIAITPNNAVTIDSTPLTYDGSNFYDKDTSVRYNANTITGYDFDSWTINGTKYQTEQVSFVLGSNIGYIKTVTNKYVELSYTDTIETYLGENKAVFSGLTGPTTEGNNTTYQFNIGYGNTITITADLISFTLTPNSSSPTSYTYTRGYFTTISLVSTDVAEDYSWDNWIVGSISYNAKTISFGGGELVGDTSFVAHYSSLYYVSFATDTEGTINSANRITYVATLGADIISPVKTFTDEELGTTKYGYKDEVTITITVLIGTGYRNLGIKKDAISDFLTNNAPYEIQGSTTGYNSYNVNFTLNSTTQGHYVAYFIQRITIAYEMLNGGTNTGSITSSDPLKQSTTNSEGRVIAVTVDYNYSVTMTVTNSDSNVQFIGWYNSDDARVSTSTTYTLNATTSATYTAKYEDLYHYTFTVETIGNTNAGNKITVSASESAIRGGYRAGVVLTVNISVASGYVFKGTYFNSALYKDSNTKTFTITVGASTAGEYIARFTQLMTVTVKTMPNGIGNTITITGGAGASGTNSATITVEYNTSITITTNATVGNYSIDGFYDGTSKLNSSNTYTVSVKSNKTYTIQYKATGRELIITGLGSVSLTNAGQTITYQTGEYAISNIDYTVVVTPDDYNTFAGVYVGGTLLSNNTSFTLSAVPSGQELTSVEVIFNAITWANSNMRASAFASGSGTENDPYVISSASQIGYLAYKTATGTDYEGTYFKLSGNINMTGAYHMPIRDFAGHINGQGYTISNVSIMGYDTVVIDDLADDSAQNYIRAFISSTKTGASVENLTILGTVVDNTTSLPYQVSTDIITEIDTGETTEDPDGNIVPVYDYEITTVTTNYSITAGLIGYAYGETYVNEVIVDMNMTVGNDEANCWIVGGLVGLSAGRLGIYASTFDGSIDVTLSANTIDDIVVVGGLVGMGLNRVAISQSATRGGNISLLAGQSTAYNGAIVGLVQESVVNIYDVYSTASVFTNSHTVYSGLIGSASGDIDGALNLGSVTVDSSAAVVYTGGIMGYAGLTANNAYYRNSITSSGSAVGTALSDNDLKDKTKMNLKFGAPWVVTRGSFPVLAKLDVTDVWSSTTPVSATNGIYEISTPEQLAYIATHMPTSGEIAITNDIDMSGKIWNAFDIPAGVTFNGRGYTISGLTLINNAFIGTNNGTVKQLVIKDSGLVADISSTYYGLVIDANRGNVYKLIAENSNITKQKINKSGGYIGGLIGILYDGYVVSKSSFDGTISYRDFQTKFIVNNNGNRTVTFLGGAVGYAYEGSLDQVYANVQYDIFSFGDPDRVEEVIDKTTGEIVGTNNIKADEEIYAAGLVGSIRPGSNLNNVYSNVTYNVVQVGLLCPGSLIGLLNSKTDNIIVEYAYAQSIGIDANLIYYKSGGHIEDNSTVYGTGDGGHPYEDVKLVSAEDGWDFEDIWYYGAENENYGAPMLQNANNDHEIEVIINNNGSVANTVQRADGTLVLKAPHMADTNYVVTFIPDTNWVVYEILLDGVAQTVGNTLDLGKVDDEHTIEVTFKLAEYTFSTEVSPDESYGSIDITAGPDMDGLPNSPGYYDYGTEITLTAIDNGTDSVFGYWLVNGVRLESSNSTYTIGRDENGKGTIRFLMTGVTATKYTAVFDKQYPVDVQVSGPSGVDISTVGTASITRQPDREPNMYMNGSTINISIEAYTGYQFDKVMLGDVVISSNSIYTISQQGENQHLLTFTLSQTTSGTYTVYFIKKQYKVTVDVVEGLEITSITSGGRTVTLNEDNEFFAEYLDQVVVNYNVLTRYQFDSTHGTYLWNNAKTGTLGTNKYTSPNVTGESTLQLQAQRLYWDDLEVIQNVTLSGAGTDENPYIVASAAGYGKMIDMINATDQSYNTSVFMIRADAIGGDGIVIDLSSRFVRSIGTSSHPFTGKIIGSGYNTNVNYATLYNMYGIDDMSAFIGYANGAVVEGLHFDNMNLTTNSNGSLFAYNLYSSIIGNINISSGHLQSLGRGLFANMVDSTTIYQVGIEKDVMFTFENSSNEGISAFVVINKGLIQNCYVYAELIKGENAYEYMISTGIAYKNQGIIKNCISGYLCDVQNTHAVTCYNLDYAQILDTYYIKNNSQYNGVVNNSANAVDTTVAVGTGIANVESSYPMLNFAQIWTMDETIGMPRLSPKNVSSSETTVTPTVSDNVLNISNAIQLYSLAKLIAQGNAIYNNANLVINLTSDIDMSGYEMIPIGTEQYPFVAKFDGGYHTISNVYLDYVHDNISNTGLFGVVGTGAEICNVTVSVSMIAGTQNVGIIGSVSQDAFIHGVTTTSDTYTRGTIVGQNNVGVIGTIAQNSANIINIGNNVDIFGKQNVGVVGTSASTIQSVYNTGSVIGTTNIGALVGNSTNGIAVSNGYNRGTIYGRTAINQVASHNYMLGESAGKFNNVYSYSQYVDQTSETNIQIRIISNSTGAVTANVANDSFVITDNENNIFVNNYDFDFTNVWSLMDGENDNMPILRYFYSRTITVTYNEFGTVEPSGDNFGFVYVILGGDITFDFIANEHYHAEYIEVDGTRIDNVGDSYIFNSVTEDHTLNVVFEIDKFNYTWQAQLQSKASTDDAAPALTDITSSMIMSGAGEYAYADYSYVDGDGQQQESPRNVILRVDYDSTTYRFIGIMHNGAMIDTTTTYENTSILVYSVNTAVSAVVLSLHANEITAGDYIAVFTKQYTLQIQASPADYGSVDITEGQHNGTVGWYDHGTNITVTATNVEGTQFVRWVNDLGATVSTNSSYSFVITENTNLTAIFELVSYEVTLDIGYRTPEDVRVDYVSHGTVTSQIGTGEVTDQVSGDIISTTYGSTLRIMATPDARMRVEFVVTGATYTSGVDGRTTIITIDNVTQDITIQVTFVQDLWTDHAASSIANVSGSTYTIMSAEELAYVSKMGSAWTQNKTFVLGADIDLNDYYWTPMNLTDTTFNGNWHTISNMKVIDRVHNSLISTIYDCVIKNIKISELYLDRTININDISNGNPDQNLCIASLVSEARFSIIQNCYVMSGEINVKDFLYNGGVVAFMLWSKVENCINYAEIYITNDINNSSYNFVGGIVGVGYGYVTKCINYGNINLIELGSIKAAFRGGIIGDIANNGTYNDSAPYLEKEHGTITQCMNFGSIIGEYGSAIVGYSNDSVIKDNVNYGDAHYMLYCNPTSSSNILNNLNAGNINNWVNSNSGVISSNNYSTSAVTTGVTYVEDLTPESLPTLDFDRYWIIYNGTNLETYNSKYLTNYADLVGTPILRGAVTIGNWSDIVTDADALVMDDNKFSISSPKQLAWLSNKSNSDASYTTGKTFVIANDIDMFGKYFTPISSTSTFAFKGQIDGNNNSIDYLTTQNGGLVGYISSTMTQQNVVLNNPFIDIKEKEINDLYVGAFAGNVTADVSNITVIDGSVGVDVGNYSTIVVGTIIGHLQGDATLLYSSANLYNDISTDISTQNYYGGLVGQLVGDLTESAYVGDIEINVASTVGGLVGYANSNSLIDNSYAITNVTLQNVANYGSMIGQAQDSTVTLQNIYTVANIQPYSVKPTVNNCLTTYGSYNDVGSIESVTSEYLKDYRTFDNTWDFTKIWSFIEGQNNGYPVITHMYTSVEIVITVKNPEYGRVYVSGYNYSLDLVADSDNNATYTLNVVVGNDMTVTFETIDETYVVSNVRLDNVSTTNPVTMTNVTAGHTVSAEFLFSAFDLTIDMSILADEGYEVPQGTKVIVYIVNVDTGDTYVAIMGHGETKTLYKLTAGQYKIVVSAPMYFVTTITTVTGNTDAITMDKDQTVTISAVKNNEKWLHGDASTF